MPINCGMKAVLVVAVALFATVAARADWKDLKKGMDRAAAAQCVGAPILTSRGHAGAFEVWTYDSGGFVMFEGGVVTYWEPSKNPVIVFHVPAPAVKHVMKPAPNAVAKD